MEADRPPWSQRQVGLAFRSLTTAHLPAPGSPCPYLPLPPGWGHPEPPHARTSRGTPLELPYVHDSDFSAAATTEEPALDTGREGGPRKQGANVQEEAPSAAQTTSCRGFILTCLPLRSVFINSARPQRLPEPQLWAPSEPCGETAAALNLTGLPLQELRAPCRMLHTLSGSSQTTPHPHPHLQAPPRGLRLRVSDFQAYQQAPRSPLGPAHSAPQKTKSPALATKGWEST